MKKAGLDPDETLWRYTLDEFAQHLESKHPTVIGNINDIPETKSTEAGKGKASS